MLSSVVAKSHKYPHPHKITLGAFTILFSILSSYFSVAVYVSVITDQRGEKASFLQNRTQVKAQIYSFKITDLLLSNV